MNLPNKLTILRIILIPVFIAVYFISAIPFNYGIAAVVFAVAAITDFMDGIIARKYHLITDFGKFLDPVADKVLVEAAFISMLVVIPNGVTIIPWYGAIGVVVILARELIISGFRMVAASKGKVLAAEWSGKIKTCGQDITIFWLLVTAQLKLLLEAGSTFVKVLEIIGNVGVWICVALTIISGLECLLKNKDVLKDDLQNDKKEIKEEIAENPAQDK